MHLVLLIGAFALALWDALRNPETHMSGRICQIVSVTFPAVAVVVLQLM